MQTKEAIKFALTVSDRAVLSDLYRIKAALVRSDHHVAWRGDEPPADPGRVIDVITGNSPLLR